MRKEIKRLVKLAESKGWRVTHNGHLKFYCPCGDHIVTIPSTPGGGNRSRENTRGLLTSTARLGSCAFPKDEISGLGF